MKGQSITTDEHSELCPLEPPFFKARPTSEIVVVTGGYFMLRCEAHSVGLPLTTRLEWQRSGRTLSKSDRILLFSDGTLLVSRVRVSEDGGNYSCMASNAYGISIASSHVIVLRELYNCVLCVV